MVWKRRGGTVGQSLADTPPGRPSLCGAEQESAVSRTHGGHSLTSSSKEESLAPGPYSDQSAPPRHPQQPLPALLASVPAEAPHPLAVFTGRSSTWGWGWWPWARSPQAWVLFATKVEHEGFTNHDTFQPAKQRPVLMAARPPHHSLRCMGTGRPAVPQVIWQCRQGTLLCPSFFRSLGPCILPTPTRAHQLPSCALCIVTAP